MPELSIIVPVYKVEKYLPKCVDSILAQTFKDFELILIDDGSPDRCGELCDEYAAKDPRIQVIHQKNQGVSAARNAGLELARGEYIGFVDSDDWIEPEMYETMITAAADKGVDVVICSANQWSESGTLLFHDFRSDGDYTGTQLLQAMYSTPNPLGGCLWNKLFRAEAIRSNRFRQHLTNCEDTVFIVECFFSLQNGIKISKPLYNVVQRGKSASRSGNIGQVYRTICGFAEMKDLLRSHKHEKKLDSLAANMVLDSCVRFSQEILRIHRETDAPCHMELRGVRKIMMSCIMEAAVQRTLTIRQLHGYFHEMRLIHEK